MKAWSKYGQVLNDPVRNLNVRLAFQDGEVTVVHSKHLNVSSSFQLPFLFVLYSV